MLQQQHLPQQHPQHFQLQHHLLHRLRRRQCLAGNYDTAFAAVHHHSSWYAALFSVLGDRQSCTNCYCPALPPHCVKGLLNTTVKGGPSYRHHNHHFFPPRLVMSLKLKGYKQSMLLHKLHHQFPVFYPMCNCCQMINLHEQNCWN